jgi:hypothetical protein
MHNQLLGCVMKYVRCLFLMVPLLAGCAYDRPCRVTGAYPDSPCVRRCLTYWVSNFSTNATNHFYVGTLRGGAFDAFVYWKEERTILNYDELDPAAVGGEAMAWRGDLKLDRDTADTWEDAHFSTFVVTHQRWVDWMEQCLSHGREYVISLDEARRLSPERKIPADR